jgi:hypothetical protein
LNRKTPKNVNESKYLFFSSESLKEVISDIHNTTTQHTNDIAILDKIVNGIQNNTLDSEFKDKFQLFCSSATSQIESLSTSLHHLTR